MSLLVGLDAVPPLAVVAVVVVLNDGPANGLLENRGRDLSSVGRVLVGEVGSVMLSWEKLLAFVLQGRHRPTSRREDVQPRAGI